MSSPVAVIDYGTGNLRSVINAVRQVGGEALLVAKPEELCQYRHLILPGVGSFRHAMGQLHSRGFVTVLRELVEQQQVALLGICLGMQLLAKRSSEDGETEGLGLIDCEVDRFDMVQLQEAGLKVPHVGFNSVSPRPDSRLFSNLGGEVDFYFTHSYRMRCMHADVVAAECWHGENFVAAVEQGHVAATQFHPEKSQANGLKLIKNFLEYF